jgi:hypothetical protein
MVENGQLEIEGYYGEYRSGNVSYIYVAKKKAGATYLDVKKP